MIIHCSKKLAATRAQELMALCDAHTTQIRLADAIVEQVVA